MKYTKERINCGRFATRAFDKNPAVPELGRGQKMIVWMDSVPRPRDSKEEKLWGRYVSLTPYMSSTKDMSTRLGYLGGTNNNVSA